MHRCEEIQCESKVFVHNYCEEIQSENKDKACIGMTDAIAKRLGKQSTFTVAIFLPPPFEMCEHYFDVRHNPTMIYTGITMRY